jgi:hypothetical protein
VQKRILVKLLFSTFYNALSMAVVLAYLSDPVISFFSSGLSCVLTAVVAVDYFFWPRHLCLYIEAPLYLSYIPTMAGLATALL